MAMKVLRSKLRRHIIWPSIMVLAAIALSPFLFSYHIPPTLLWLSVYAMGVVGLLFAIGLSIDRNLLGPVEKLAKITD